MFPTYYGRLQNYLLFSVFKTSLCHNNHYKHYTIFFKMISLLEENYKLSFFITFVIASLIFWISSLTLGSSTLTISLNAILYHIFAFFFFTGFLLISFVRGKRKSFVFFLTIIISMVYAISDEMHQFFVPFRNSSFFDFLLDFTGILLAFLIYLIIILSRKTR